jgi:hypothetical protein
MKNILIEIFCHGALCMAVLEVLGMITSYNRGVRLGITSSKGQVFSMYP